MGYESRIYVVEESNILLNDNKVYAETIAVIDMCKCSNKFIDVFENEANGYIYVDGEQTDTDRYGEKIKCADIDDVIVMLKEVMCEHYNRYDILYGILTSFDKRDWRNLKIYHFGY